MTEHKPQVEILAPAGEMEALKQAVYADCDAVYAGGDRFGARANAVNFSKEDLLWAIDFVHLHGKKLYLTVNTLFKERELNSQLYDWILPYYEAGLDGVIVQDLGVMSLLHKELPLLPLHASTQLTVTGSLSLKLLSRLGITRVVPSRELSLPEIRKIKDETGLEIECFVQGALCFSYSGQCLMSSMIGGRSGNRGRCAQPCRKEYELSFPDRKNFRGYPLSPRDLCTLSLLPDFIEAGIDSFKIEGRMKKPEYAAFTSRLYRKYADYYLEKGRAGYQEVLSSKEFQEDMRDLKDLYNRGGFTSGYSQCYNGKDMMADKRASHFGVQVGQMQRKGILLSERIHPGDVLEIREKNSLLPLLERTVPKEVSKKEPGELFPLVLKKEDYSGHLVYRVKNEALQSEIRKWMETPKKQPVSAVFMAKKGKPATLSLKLCSDHTKICVTGPLVSQAEKQPVSREKAEACLRKIQNLDFYYESLVLDMEEDVFLPVGQLNELRRTAFSQLSDEILIKYRRPVPERMKESKKAEQKTKDISMSSLKSEENGFGFRLSISSMEQLAAVFDCLREEDGPASWLRRLTLNSIYFSFEELNAIRGQIKKENESLLVGLTMPPIFRWKTMEKWKYFTDIRAFDFVCVRNLEELSFVKEMAPSLVVEADASLYAMNQSAREFLKEAGASSFISNVELNERELSGLKKAQRGDFLLVYGHLPLMQTAQCLVKNYKGCQKESLEYVLKDAKGSFFGRNFCGLTKDGVLSDCLNLIYNGTVLSLLSEADAVHRLNPELLCLDFTRESRAETKKVLKRFYRTFILSKKAEGEGTITKGHFRRGIE